MEATTDKPKRRGRPPKELEDVFYDRYRCSSCGSPHLSTFDTVDNGDGSISRQVRCKDCDYEFRLILE
jgi:DNA-directed RNA polymerase subunit RPC12/RpoP